MTVRQAKQNFGKQIVVSTKYGEQLTIILVKQEKPRSQCFFYGMPGQGNSLGLMNVTDLTVKENEAKCPGL